MTDTLFNRTQAVERAKRATRNRPNTCQLWVRTIVGAPSAGDQDGDGDADAVDGWLSEPVHRVDRRPPAGTPVAWAGGSNGNGHRALSLGPDKHGRYWIRSTDAAGAGRVATVPLDWPEKTWGLIYLGWSPTMDGRTIPQAPLTRGTRVDDALRKVRHAKAPAGSERRSLLDRAAALLARITPHRKG